MKKIISIFAIVIFTLSLAAYGQVGISKVGDQIKFTGLGIGNGIYSNSRAYSEVYSGSVDQVMIQSTSQGYNLIFLNSASKGIVASVPWTRITDKLGNTTPQAYVEEIISLGYLAKSPYESVTIFSGTNKPKGTQYLPDSTGIDIGGYKDISIYGYLTEGHAKNDSIMCQVSSDAGLTWNTVYGYNWKTNTTVNQLKQTGAGTLSVAWSFPNLNFERMRITAGLGDSTNVIKLYGRKIR